MKKRKNLVKATAYAIVGAFLCIFFFMKSIEMWGNWCFQLEDIGWKFIIQQILLFVGMVVSKTLMEYGLEYILEFAFR